MIKLYPANMQISKMFSQNNIYGLLVRDAKLRDPVIPWFRNGLFRTLIVCILYALLLLQMYADLFFLILL